MSPQDFALHELLAICPHTALLKRGCNVLRSQLRVFVAKIILKSASVVPITSVGVNRFFWTEGAAYCQNSCQLTLRLDNPVITMRRQRCIKPTTPYERFKRLLN